MSSATNVSELELKIPVESLKYPEWSRDLIGRVRAIIQQAIDTKNNMILIHTNLRRGLPLENINKIAGPFVEAWAVEQFELISEQKDNGFHLIYVEAGRRLDVFDVVLQFKRDAAEDAGYLTANVDVKATAQDIVTSGKSPNITSYAKIRSEYVADADYVFLILSLRHKVYGERDPQTGMTNGIMEVVSCAVYDLKYLSESDISYNPALGTGQIQIRDMQYISTKPRTTVEFVQILDAKFIRSQGEQKWREFARKYQWIKEDV